MLFNTKALYALVILCICSCHQNADDAGYSAAFKPVKAKVDVLFGINQVTEGLHYLDSAVIAIHPTNDDKFRTYAFHYVYESKVTHDIRRALSYADSMLTIANKNINDPQYVSNYAEANFAMGDAYFSGQAYNEAYQHFLKGYKLAKNNLNNGALAEYTYRMGMIMYKMGNYPQAINYFSKSYNYRTKPNSVFVEFYAKQELLDNIALSFKHTGQPDSAVAYFDKAIVFLNRYGPQFTDRPKMIDMARGVVYGNKADVLIKKGDYKQATDLWQKSIAINLRKDYDFNDAELTEIKMGQLYLDNHNDKALFSLLQKMRPQLDSVKNESAETDWNRLMSKYYIQKNDFSKALNYLQSYNTLKDSSIKKLSLLKESDINKQLDSYEKEQQIAQLSVKNRNQTIYLLVITIVAFMTLLIILLIYRNWKRSRNDVLKVNLLNQQINEQNIVLEKALNEIKGNSQEKDRILRTVAHDLRNPIGGIASLTAMMTEYECSDEQLELINLVKETSFNALELINEILEATNIAAVETKLEPVDINMLVSNSVGLLRFKAAEKNQQIFLKPLEKSLQLTISREKIWRVISNLISNAIKFSPNGSPINVQVTTTRKEVIVAVEDNGIGIPDDLKDKIFNMFTTAQRPGTAGEKSFGLGLSICRQIMEKFDGKIWFESKKNGGTIFYISLPITNKTV